MPLRMVMGPSLAGWNRVWSREQRADVAEPLSFGCFRHLQWTWVQLGILQVSSLYTPEMLMEEISEVHSCEWICKVNETEQITTLHSVYGKNKSSFKKLKLWNCYICKVKQNLKKERQILRKPFCLIGLVFEKDRMRECTICWSNVQMPGSMPGSKPGVRNSVLVSHRSGRNSTTWAIIGFLSGFAFRNLE